MPLPLLAGATGIASVFGSALAGISTFFAVIFTQRLALSALLVTTMISSGLLFTAAMAVLLNQITYSAIPAWMQAGFYLLPPNIDTCFGIIAAAKVTRWVYDWQQRTLVHGLN